MTKNRPLTALIREYSEDVCKRAAKLLKRYIYALLLGAGKGKLQEILACDEATAAKAL